MNEVYFVNAEGQEAFLAQQLNRILTDIDYRLQDLEYKTSKVGKKPDISRAEKMALLHELDVLNFLLQKGIPQNKVAHILSLILNASEGNIEKDLSTRNNRDAPFKSEEVYKFVVNKFAMLRLNDHEAKAQKTLGKIEASKEK